MHCDIAWLGVHRYSLVKDVRIPGPAPWPFLGNVPEILQHGVLHKLFTAYSKTYGRVYKMAIGRTPVIVLTDPEMAKQIMVKHFREFPNRSLPISPTPPLEVGIFAGRDAQWKRVRSVLAPVFTAAKLRQMLPMMEEACDSLLDEMDAAAGRGTVPATACASCAFCIFSLVCQKGANHYDNKTAVFTLLLR